MAQAKAGATVDDLYRAKGKAEIVGGELVLMSATGFLPGRAGASGLDDAGRRALQGQSPRLTHVTSRSGRRRREAHSSTPFSRW